MAFFVWLTTCFVAPKPFVSITAIPAFQISEEEYATLIGKRGCVGGSCYCWIRRNVSRSHQRHRRRSIGGDGRGGDSEGHERGHRRYADPHHNIGWPVRFPRPSAGYLKDRREFGMLLDHNDRKSDGH